MARARRTDLVKMARKIQDNNYSSEPPEKLIQIAKESIYSGKSSEVRGMDLRILIDQIQSLENTIKEIDDKIEATQKLCPPRHQLLSFLKHF